MARITKILTELRTHVPFTVAGTMIGIFSMLIMFVLGTSRSTSETLFWIMHPSHVILSALVTTALYRLNGGRGFWKIFLVGYVGSIGIATLSDSIIPFVSEWILEIHEHELHVGFIEKWWLVNPLAFLGIGLGVWHPRTKVFHSAHVLISTWASLFHITMALNLKTFPEPILIVEIAFFLFLSVWIPCCTSDIVFPLLFVKSSTSKKTCKDECNCVL